MRMKAVLSLLVLAGMTGAGLIPLWRQFFFVNLNLNWNESKAYCRKNYVDLLTIETLNELNRYKWQIGSKCYGDCWIGLRRSPDNMRFTQWSDGSTSNIPYINSILPLHDTSKMCVTADSNGNTNDDYCTARLNFICYIWKAPLIVVQELKTWEEALKYCRTKYTDLVSLDTKRIQLAVSNKSSEIQTPFFWTGLRFLDGSWFWVNQNSLDEENLGNLSYVSSCPAPCFRCGAQETQSNIVVNRDCMEKMNFICYNYTQI